MGMSKKWSTKLYNQKAFDLAHSICREWLSLSAQSKDKKDSYSLAHNKF